MMRSPICLWMTSRSRSSMISGIFAAHGVNWGGNQQQSLGYDIFENEAVKRVQKRHYGLPYCELIEATGAFLTDLYSVVPQNETWLVKTGIEYFNAFQPLAPFNVYLLRKPEGAAQSIVNKRGVDYDEALKAVKWRFAAMRARQAIDGGAFIDTDRVIAGDFEQLQAAMEYCGVLFDEKKTKGAIHK